MRRSAVTDRQADQLVRLGYNWTYNSRGYRVTFRGEFVRAAGVLPSAPKARGAAVRANCNFNREMARLAAWQDFQARHTHDPQSLEVDDADAE